MAAALIDANARGAVYDESTKKVLAYADKNLDVLLIGKTGNGKSKTGNTILGRDFFEECSSCELVTQSVSTGVVQIGDRIIKVVDGPGVGDTSEIKDLEKATLLVMDSMKNAVNFSPEGYHAFLLVVKYGGRFTREDFECIRLVKTIFGDYILKRLCILIVTHGDLFAKDKKNNSKSFKEWCSEQKGVFKDLLTECDNRAILFDNHSTNENVKSAQVSALLNMIDNLQHGGRRYNFDNFQQTESKRKIILVKSKELKLRDEILNKLSLIIDEYKTINDYDEPATEIAAIRECIKELQKLISEVLKEDNETNVFANLITQIKGQEEMMNQRKKSLKEINDFILRLNEAGRKHMEEQEKLNQIIISSREEQNQQCKTLEEKRKIMELEAKEKEETLKQLQAKSEQKQREDMKQEKLKHKLHIEKLHSQIVEMEKNKEQSERYNILNTKLENEYLSRELEDKKAKIKLLKTKYQLKCDELVKQIYDREMDVVRLKFETQNLHEKLEKLEKEKSQFR